MVPQLVRGKVVLDRLELIDRMIARIRTLPLASPSQFSADPHVSAAAESYLRRCLEALLDVGRHILAKGFGRPVTEYKTIATTLQEVGILDSVEAELLREMAGYRNRLTHFYDEVTQKELYEICTQGIGDIEKLLKRIDQWMRDHPERIDQKL